jgi:hypothetical protein
LLQRRYGPSGLEIDPSLPPKSSHGNSPSLIEILDSDYERETIASILTNSTLPTSVSDIQEEQKGIQVIGDDLSLRLRAAKIVYLIDAFASEICRGVAETPSLENSAVTRIYASLPRLLKEFSQEMVEVANSGTQKNATKFVRRYRRYFVSIILLFILSSYISKIMLRPFLVLRAY